MSKINEFRSKLNRYVNPVSQVIAGEELAKNPPYPYVEMFVLNQVIDFHTNDEQIISRIDNTVKEKTIKFNTAMLQLNCRHKTINEALELANTLYKIINYVKREDLINAGIGIKNMSQIRSLHYQEAGKWTYCFSFAVEICFDTVEEKNIDTIGTIEITIKNEEVTFNE